MPLRAIFSLFFALTLAVQAASTQFTEEDLAALAEKGVIESLDYWRENATETGKCHGEHVATLLMKIARLTMPVKTLDEALEVLRRENELLRKTIEAADGSVVDLEAQLKSAGIEVRHAGIEGL